MLSKIRTFTLLLLFSLNALPNYAQVLQEISTPIDSLLEFFDEQLQENTPKVDRLTLEENIKKAQQYTLQLNRVNHVVNQSLDTAKLGRILPRAELFSVLAGTRLENQETKMNLRFLNALENWMVSISEELTNGERLISNRAAQLMEVRLKLDSIQQDALMRASLRDTTLLPEYQLTISTLRTNLSKTDSTLNQQRLIAASYQSRASNLIIRLNDIKDRIIGQKRELERALFEKETNFIWEPRDFPSTERLIYVFRDSVRFNLNITRNYIINHLGTTFFLLLLVILFYTWINKNLKKIASYKEFSELILGRLKYISKNTLLSAFLVITSLAPFFYPNPPVPLFSLILVITVSLSGILLRNRIGEDSFKVWWMMFALFLISIASNLYWEVAYQERWHLLVFSLFGIYIGWNLIQLQKETKEYLPAYIPLVARTYMILCGISIIANILGRFSLSKMIGITATLSLMHAVPLIIVVAIIKEVIYLMIEVSQKRENDFTSSIDFYDIQKRVNRVASFLAVLIWAYFFAESLGVFDTIILEAKNFLSKPRNLLNASFTYSQVAIFILILYVANFLANTVAYLAAIKDQQSVNVRSKKLGSSILLIRLSLLIVGFLLAAAASGISLDKIAIVLGAFSLGISFGLQTIVNNLVSGIILAFEKPIQIGDTVQVGNIEGIVRDIGIRASKIKNWDGAEVIIPNGDLLAQHLTNWTLSDKQRRVELIIGVSYNSDLDLVTKLIQDQLEVQGILNYPPPRILLQTFADNSVNFRVLFWVEDVDVWVTIRDQVMRGIFKSFKDNGVEIPFPQRDLHIKSFPGLIKEKLSKPHEE
ncbi:mechanosensitive ion channel family protein [Cecembia rubra]|uniref:mechanosensitive ion channel family protein n=1 Tax=Cecembia rubra TaxID=1485585 RepID=UPI0027146DEB|nr:mechanosensitive ion channel domain-containing protein [Cecembia rubra]